MNDLKQQLVDGDPVAREGGWNAFDAHRIRRRIMAEPRTAPADVLQWWPRPFAVAGALAVCMLLAIIIGTRLNMIEHGVPRPPAVERARTRQMQFATAGGTRIIWTFHQDLEL
jgi:hypothetical protein